jgi:hypothetical protein
MKRSTALCRWPWFMRAVGNFPAPELEISVDRRRARWPQSRHQERRAPVRVEDKSRDRNEHLLP